PTTSRARVERVSRWESRGAQVDSPSVRRTTSLGGKGATERDRHQVGGAAAAAAGPPAGAAPAARATAAATAAAATSRGGAGSRGAGGPGQAAQPDGPAGGGRGRQAACHPPDASV